MRPIGSIETHGRQNSVRAAKDQTLQKLRAAGFAAIKTEWALQVAADRSLSEIAVRIALAWPLWLNSKSLLAWPSQVTIANTLNCGARAVRDGLKRLEVGGHLKCMNKYRGGRQTNSYRIVLQDIIICEDHLPQDESGTSPPVRAATASRPEGHNDAAHLGAGEPAREGVAGRGTLERTIERTTDEQVISQTTGSSVPLPEPRVSAEDKAEILRQVFGATSVDENGHLLRR